MRARTYIAVIGDMVGSRTLRPSARAAAQKQFAKFTTSLNRRFRRSVAASFVITLGDEFQGLLLDAEVIPELVWFVEAAYAERPIRLGIGYGALHTPLRKVAINVDGPAFHEARAAISAARAKKLLGGVFSGFGAHDEILTGFAQILRQARHQMTERQREVVEILRTGKTQRAAAAALRISKQAISNHVSASGWDAYKLAERGWTTALRLATEDRRRA